MSSQTSFSYNLSVERPGRNDPCWCGSGKKYKRCHLDIDERDIAPRLNRYVKSAAAIAGMRRAGRFNGELLDALRPLVQAGVSTDAIDKFAHDYTLDHGHTPACLGYKGYPRTICASVNNVVCHGIPHRDVILKDGDIVNIDCTTIVDGFYGDSSETFLVGEVAEPARALVRATAEALVAGIAAVRPGAPLRAIAEAIEPLVTSRGFSVVREYTGHGIGREFHEDFSVLHHRSRDRSGDMLMVPGLTFTIEPMVNAGDWRTVLDTRDGWTVYTADQSLSAQFEHTVLVTESGVEVLTLTPREIRAGKTLLVDGLGEF